MINSIKRSLSSYMKNPVRFVSASITYAIFQLLAVLVAFGVFILLVFVASIVNINVIDVPLFVISAISLLVFCYFSGAFYASLINSYNQIMVGNNVKFLDFYKFAMERASTIFGISVLRGIVVILFTAPILLLYFYVLKDQQLPVIQPYLLQIVQFIALFMAFFANLLFFAAPIHAVTSRTGVFQSIKAGLGTIRQKHIFALISYGVYSLVFLTLLIPLLDILTLLVIYPIILSALITLTLNTKTLPSKLGKKR
ncbi:MAG: hypothetical protein Q7S22_06180 [Candidatus Micrarchaeota archaeon]|nr:hypothetical protein [Candidatus Micrarchaeota archaeon]